MYGKTSLKERGQGDGAWVKGLTDDERGRKMDEVKQVTVISK